MNNEKISVFDNGGETIDRYTVIIGNLVYGMSSNATSPSGFNQYCGDVSDFPALFRKPSDPSRYLTPIHLGIEVTTCLNSCIPDEVKRAIKNRAGG